MRWRRGTTLLTTSKERLVLPCKQEQQKNKKTATKDFAIWQSNLPDTHLIAFSDGSKGPNEAFGGGFAIQRNGRKLNDGKGSLGHAEVFGGEAVGAWRGLHQAYRTDPGATTYVDHAGPPGKRAKRLIRGLLGVPIQHDPRG
jgi:hypothetical protein